MFQSKKSPEPRRLRVENCRVATPIGTKALKGKAMGELCLIDNAQIDCEDGKITYCGPRRPRGLDSAPTEIIDAKGRICLPGFVDSHTHLVFGGYRPDEFMWRMRGDSYMDIMNRGGGIASTVNATRSESFAKLVLKAEKYLRRMTAMGVTTVEAKSGYGLDYQTELDQLDVIANLKKRNPELIDLSATFLGAHACPKEYKEREDEYIDFLINEMLPEVKKRGLAEFCDIFCEKGVFTVEQSRRLLKAAQALGFKAKIHADEIVTTGGAELAAEIGAFSADHLLHVSEDGIHKLAESDTVATLLPLTAFALREPFAPARKMIDAGCAVALATDLNPGSCHSGSIPLTFALACIYMNMTVEESITALTLNGAAALGLAASKGSLEAGKDADIVILDSDKYTYLPYYTGMNSVAVTIHKGYVSARND